MNWKNDKKLINFYADETLLNAIEEMKTFYDISNTSELLRMVILKHYESYKDKKENKSKQENIIVDVLNRLKKIENKVFGKGVSIETLSKEVSKKKSKPVLTTDINFNPDEMNKIITDEYSKGLRGNDICEILKDKGFTSKTGKELNRNIVDKMIMKLNLPEGK